MEIPAGLSTELTLLLLLLAWIAREVWPWFRQRLDSSSTTAQQRETEERKHRSESESKMAQAIDLIGRTLVSIDFNLQEIRRMTEKRFDHVDQRLELIETGLVQGGHFDRRKNPFVKWVATALGAVLVSVAVWRWGKQPEVTK